MWLITGGIKIAKQQACQKFIYKIHSSRLRKNKWNIILPIDEARRNGEVIALADSQILRWIDEEYGITDRDVQYRNLKNKIKSIKKLPNSTTNRGKIRTLYRNLDALLLQPHYMHLIIDKNKDYYRACKGFKINGITYKRLLGTNGGVKNSTIVFVNEELLGCLNEKINNNRDISMEFIPAKLEAYNL